MKHVIWKEGRYWVAQSLNVDVSSLGETRQEALANLREALELFLEDVSVGSGSSVEHPEIVTV